MKKYFIYFLLICLIFLFTGCATTTGAITLSEYYLEKEENIKLTSKEYAIFIDGEFIYENHEVITDLPVGNHHIVVRKPNKTLMDSTIYVNNDWSIRNQSYMFLGLILSTSLALIPFPFDFLDFLYVLIVPSPLLSIYLASSSFTGGAVPLRIQSDSKPILKKIDSTIKIQLKPNENEPKIKNNTLNVNSLYLYNVETNEICYDINAPEEPLVWFRVNRKKLNAMPRKNVNFCAKTDYLYDVSCTPLRDFNIEDYLCP